MNWHKVTPTATIVIFLLALLVAIHTIPPRPTHRANDLMDEAYIMQLDCYCKRIRTANATYFVNRKADTVAIIFAPYKVIEWEINKIENAIKL